jgi:hypothetical protein
MTVPAAIQAAQAQLDNDYDAVPGLQAADDAAAQALAEAQLTKTQTAAALVAGLSLVQTDLAALVALEQATYGTPPVDPNSGGGTTTTTTAAPVGPVATSTTTTTGGPGSGPLGPQVHHR